MKLIYYIMLRVSLSIAVVLGLWAGLFYYIIVDEVEDEVDDVLEDYSAMIIQNFLAGEQMPTNDNGSNNTYYLRAIPADSLAYARSREGFFNEQIFISYKKELEPARLLRQVFRDREDNYFEVTVITPTIDDSDLIKAIWNSLGILFILLLIVVLAINILAIRGGLQPLQKFLIWLNHSDVESSSTTIAIDSSVREIKELSRAIESFASRGRKAFEQQKEFIGNASHELQTPIAICQNRLELLCESGLNEAQMEDVAGCLTTLSRLSKLNKSLLMLSKIDNGGFEIQTIDINELVARNISTLEEIHQSRNISIIIIEHGRCQIEANRELAATLMLNLLKNGYSHNIDGGEIRVGIATDSLTIENSGSNIALDSQKIFHRFYQGGSKSGSYGLGLPIVQSICRLYGFTIDYSFIESRHVFKIKFK